MKYHAEERGDQWVVAVYGKLRDLSLGPFVRDICTCQRRADAELIARKLNGWN